LAEYDIIIIGAGISGLSLAHYCARAGLKTLILEKSDRTGGAFHSHSFAADAPGFWIELGTHTCYNSYANLIGILEDDGVIDRLMPREKAPFKMLVNNELKSIPSQLSFPALLPALWRNFALKKKGESLKSYYSKLVGARNYDRVLGNAFSAVISQPADDYPADLLFNKRGRRKDILRKFTFPGGLQTVTNTIAAEKDIDIVTGARVTAIEEQGGRISVDTDKGSHGCDRLAMATPASVTAELLKTAWPGLAEKLARIKVNKAETVGVAVDKEAVSIERFANLIPRNDLFFSVVSRDIVPDPNFRGFTFHFKPGVAGPEAKLKRIGEVLKVKPDELTRVVMKDNFVPALKVGHEKLIGEIDAGCAGKNLFLIGNYFSGMAVEDCVCRSLAEFNRLALGVR